MIRYEVGRSGQLLIITDEVLDHFRRHRQRRWYHREAGGQLFARVERAEIKILEATGPRRTDKRGRRVYIPDRAAEQAEICERHARGMHFVGDWHTHPERTTRPSASDALNLAESVVKSVHNLNGFVLVVVGWAEPPSGLHVSVHDGLDAYELQPLDSYST